VRLKQHHIHSDFSYFYFISFYFFFFSISAPGGFSRWLIFRFAADSRRRVVHVLLTRDTTDSDLKQRRELRQSSLFLTVCRHPHTHTHAIDSPRLTSSVTIQDGPVVRAATSGAILILEGVERAERNVLPVLNNLLENRECPLENGASLVSASRHAILLRTHTPSSLHRLECMFNARTSSHSIAHTFDSSLKSCVSP
jgi:hypothetical protein